MAKPAIVTVDDDPGVSRAVARDLRRQFADDYRIVRAESGEQALEALREMRLRDEDVAVVLADQRMPELSGTEFLERAMDIYPHARRLLLTAYADTDAAIQAINVVDLDHYLLKPWDPPEEKLYPVVEAQLDAWQHSDRADQPMLRVVGHRWSARSYEVRDFLARNEVPYRWYLNDDPEATQLMEAAGQPELPLVITVDGTAMEAPDDAALAEAVGLSTSPATDFYDLIVIGGGPAGLGSAVYGASEGMRTVLVERQITGGQAGQSSRIENYLGFPDGVSGGQLTDRARRQALKFGAELLTAREVTGLRSCGSAKTVDFADGTSIAAHAIILATGVSYRQLEVPGMEALVGRGVYYGAAITEASECAGEEVYVVGGANSAGQAAVYFARHAKRVHMLVRAADLTASMSHYLIEQIEGIDAIEVHTGTQVTGVAGTDHLETITLGGSDTRETQHLFIFIGASPRTEWLDGVVQCDERGFVLAGPDLPSAGPDGAAFPVGRPVGWPLERAPYHLETSVPGIFVAGDARAESIKRVASAVGEGAMAVALVHRYLAAS